MTIITLGPEGTFSHDLASQIDIDIILVPTIGKVFQEVIRTGYDGLVPLENSEAGGVAATMDALMQYQVFIREETYLRISHALATEHKINDIQVIYAHPQSHEQCSRIIEELGLLVIHTESNAASAIKQKQNPLSAAIVSESLAMRHNIPIIRRNIENSPENLTRFVLINRDQNYYSDPEKCSIIIDPGENRAGLLYDLLSPFKDAKVNLTRIESRPSKRQMGSYIFFLDLQCEGAWSDAIDKVSSITSVKNLGCYSLLGDRPCK